MQEGDVFSCSACITVNWADDRVWRGVHWWYIGVLVWKRWWAGRHAVLCCFLSSRCEGHGCHSTIRGSGSPPAECSIVSCLLNRQSGEREVQPLLWHHCKTAKESEKTPIWWLYNYTVNAVPPPPAFFLFFPLFIPFLPPSLSSFFFFFPVECLLIKHFH